MITILVRKASMSGQFKISYPDKHVKTAIHFRHPDNAVLTTWIYGNFFGAFLAPFLLICVFYSLILRTIMETSNVGNKEAQVNTRGKVSM